MAAPLVIAVDGPAASGKSTLAQRLAGHLDLPFLDTGLLYRAVARAMLDRGQDPKDAAAAVQAAETLAPADVQPQRLRGEGVGQGASIVAAVPAVRAALLPFQRRFGGSRGAVLAGRDIGTVVCPDATFKLFVVASEAERARRRYEELRRRGEEPIYAAVLEELLERDRRDAGRSVAPMRISPEAFVLDTTLLDADAAFAAARRHIEAGLGEDGPGQGRQEGGGRVDQP
ncbi:MAG: (d)CMP kinase [Geminicoccaceae bacterium]